MQLLLWFIIIIGIILGMIVVGSAVLIGLVILVGHIVTRCRAWRHTRQS
jgi:hypothetical protein